MKKFPRIQADGSFCVIVQYQLHHNHPQLGDQITAWLNQWVDMHPIWTRAWQGGDKRETECLSYFDEFRNVPQVIHAPDDELWIKFEGQRSARAWRDWVAYIMKELTGTFPEVGSSLRVVNCGE